MSLKVVILRSAEADLRELRAYVVQNFGSAVWQASFDGLQATIGRLSRYPRSGRVPEELAALDRGRYRQVISSMNRIIYELAGQTVYIHLICDSRRDLKALLVRRLLRPD